MNEILQYIGGILGVIAFFWKVWDSFNSYVYLDLEILSDTDNYLTAKTTIENKGVWPKKLQYAFILIGEEGDSLKEILSEIMEIERKSLNITSKLTFEQIKPTEPLYTESGKALIPLPFFYAEQSRIGDEKLTCKNSIKTSKFKRGVPYSVRFAVIGRGRIRSTQDLFILREKL